MLQMWLHGTGRLVQCLIAGDFLYRKACIPQTTIIVHLHTINIISNFSYNFPNMFWDTSISVKNIVQAAQRTSSRTSSVYPGSVRPLRALHITPPKKPLPREIQTTLEYERQILNPERSETSNSGTDNEVAGYSSSYDPSETTPENELRALENECRIVGIINPLFISPANRDFSTLLDPMVGGSVHNADKLGASGRGCTRKGKVVHIRDVPGSPYDNYRELLEKLKKLKKFST